MAILESTQNIETGLRRVWRNAGAPTDGAAGTLFNRADPGDLLIDTTNKTLYQNTNTKASPTWTEKAVEADRIFAKEITFIEEGAGVYTGSVSIPAGATLVDVIVHATALWDAATSAALIVGDVADPNGFFDAVDLKATDLLAGESINFTHEGGKKGADLDTAGATHVRRRYLAGARVVTGEVTSVGAGTAGRTRITVLYTIPATVVAATFAA